MMRYHLLAIFLCSSSFFTELTGQSARAPKNDFQDHILDRMEILHGEHVDFHTTLSHTNRREAVKTAFDISQNKINLSSKDHSDIEYLFLDNNEWVKYYENIFKINEIHSTTSNKEYIDSTKTFYRLKGQSGTYINDSRYQENAKPILRHFYKTPANFFEYDHEDFYLRLNPLLNFKFGESTQDENIIFQNTRGFLLRGAIDNKVYFLTSLYENQQRFLYHIEDRINKDLAIPGNGFYKDYQSGVIDNVNGWDFLNSEAYVGFNISKSINLEFGHGNHFIGNGYHSLLLGDYANNYFYLKFDTKFWKIHYQNIFAELSVYGNNDVPFDLLIPKKYMTAHYLDFRFNKNFSLGVFEAVIFNRENHFEFQYLNPLIIYRTVEQFIGSPDNVLIGINSKWNFLNQFQLYGQIVFDEFKFNQLASSDGWWANKYGIQLGLKYLNMLNIDHLDGQLEFNRARPFLYSHRETTEAVIDKSIGSYSHFNQPLAHPLGANFNEIIAILRYQITSDLSLKAKLMHAEYGENPAGENWGGDILITSDTRFQEFNNTIGQGINTTVSQAALDVSYQLFHNFYIDLNVLYRKKNSANDILDRNTTYVGMGIRMNVANQRLDY